MSSMVEENDGRTEEVSAEGADWLLQRTRRARNNLRSRAFLPRRSRVTHGQRKSGRHWHRTGVARGAGPADAMEAAPKGAACVTGNRSESIKRDQELEHRDRRRSHHDVRLRRLANGSAFSCRGLMVYSRSEATSKEVVRGQLQRVVGPPLRYNPMNLLLKTGPLTEHDRVHHLFIRSAGEPTANAQAEIEERLLRQVQITRDRP